MGSSFLFSGPFPLASFSPYFLDLMALVFWLARLVDAFFSAVPACTLVLFGCVSWLGNASGYELANSYFVQCTFPSKIYTLNFPKEKTQSRICSKDPKGISCGCRPSRLNPNIQRSYSNRGHRPLKAEASAVQNNSVNLAWVRKSRVAGNISLSLKMKWSCKVK